jgi:hypothetical protein
LQVGVFGTGPVQQAVGVKGVVDAAGVSR